MTHAADSIDGAFTRQASHGESDRARTAGEPGATSASTSSHLPVFAAFDELGLTGRDIAAFADVTPPTVSKWRSGRVRIPDERVAFLTLVLAHLLDEATAVADLEAQCAAREGAWGSGWSARLDAARAYLAYQDVLNRDLGVAEVREGARRFREWWASGAAKALQEKRFAPNLDADLDAQLVERLKKTSARGG